MSAASKANKRQSRFIYSIIFWTAELFEWKQIPFVKQQNMISYSVYNQRINIWIKQDNKISIRMQPQNKVEKDVDITEITEILSRFNDICQYSDEGK